MTAAAVIALNAQAFSQLGANPQALSAAVSALSHDPAAFQMAASNPAFASLASSAAFGPMLSNPSFAAAITRQ